MASRRPVIEPRLPAGSPAAAPAAAASLATEQELDAFLRHVQQRAFKRTVYAVRDDDAALDIVQDAMIRLAQRYGDRPADKLPAIFQRILSNATMDWFRHRKVHQAVFSNLSDFEGPDADDPLDLLEILANLDARAGAGGADDEVQRRQLLALIEQEVTALPPRQREAFLLRYWEEFDVSETAAAMGCSEGSVKTHCSRAVRALARGLRERGIGR